MIFVIAVLIAFIVLVIHSLIYRGVKETSIFFGYGFIFGIIREIIYRTFFKNYSVSEVPLQIFGAPIAVIFGWLFTFYLGYCFCEKFLDSEEESEYSRLMVLSAIFSSYICFSIETTAMYMGWWEVFFESSNYAASDLLAGWFYSALLFFSIYNILIKKVNKNKNLILPILIIILLTIVEFTEVLMMSPSEIGIIVILIIILAIIFILYPYLIIMLLTIVCLFFIKPIRILFDNNTRILIFFAIEFIYLILIVKYPKIIDFEFIKF